MSSPAGEADLVVVANRLPFRRVTDDDGTVTWHPSPGGLVAALAPSLADIKRMAWVGWPGDLDTPDEPVSPPEVDGVRLMSVPLSSDEKRLHYDGMSNGTLWPLYHDMVAQPEFHRSWFEGYRRVNERFADATAKMVAEGGVVWIHDYQLQLVPQMLRERRPDVRIGFFLHIPFPPEELFSQLPWRATLACGILGSDLVGFQTPDGVANFTRVCTVRKLAERVEPGLLATDDGRTVQVASFPIGIEHDRYEEAAREHSVTNAARDLRARLGQPHVVLLGVDRLDYTKGIDVRLRAFKELLADGRLHASQVSMVQVAEPSRDDVDAYISLRARVEQLVGEINGDFGRVGFPVVHYIHQGQNFDQLMSMYRAADVMLVTPFRDGMNLVAKEYVASRYDDTGVLVLSEFAGAAHHLHDALLVNPHDIEGVKNAIVNAVEMAPDEVRSRMQALRGAVRDTTASDWAKSFLAAMPNA
ncbi:MAG: trehalose-6-phosphate synthase [Actinomycetota bacterium]